ncbi:hypothetical protein WJX84_010623 [Apatococcus fuscideae]|uniref:DUF2062 domain-containing protein n=1 Tax=Apatococcus fuscideae TaxID=2026836 RepID=A0AAW1T2G9_9CHLO
MQSSGCLHSSVWQSTESKCSTTRPSTNVAWRDCRYASRSQTCWKSFGDGQHTRRKGHRNALGPGAIDRQPTVCSRQLAQRSYKRGIHCTALRQYSGSGDESAGAVQEKLSALAGSLKSFYNFSRPHTMIGTFCSVCSVSLLALGRYDFTMAAAIALIQALLPALLMNICIVGVNQLESGWLAGKS